MKQIKHVSEFSSIAKSQKEILIDFFNDIYNKLVNNVISGNLILIEDVRKMHSEFFTKEKEKFSEYKDCEWFIDEIGIQFGYCLKKIVDNSANTVIRNYLDRLEEKYFEIINDQKTFEKVNLFEMIKNYDLKSEISGLSFFNNCIVPVPILIELSIVTSSLMGNLTVEKYGDKNNLYIVNGDDKKCLTNSDICNVTGITRGKDTYDLIEALSEIGDSFGSIAVTMMETNGGKVWYKTLFDVSNTSSPRVILNLYKTKEAMAKSVDEMLSDEAYSVMTPSLFQYTYGLETVSKSNATPIEIVFLNGSLKLINRFINMTFVSTLYEIFVNAGYEMSSDEIFIHTERDPSMDTETV